MSAGSASAFWPAGRRSPRRCRSWPGCGGATTITLVTERLVGPPDPGWYAWIAGTSFSVVGCLFGRRQHDLVLELRHAQAGLTRRAQAEERNRIARELHDVIAHSLTVALMHISSARLAVRDDPADADRVLAEAERLSRASLEEVRYTVGLLHKEGSTDPAAPLPASTDVATLLDGFRAAGADIQTTIDGDLSEVPATVGLATYRILQELLTNAARHASGQPVSVELQISDNAIQLSIDSSGRPGHGRGLGLTSMHGRAKTVGGECIAGPGGSGWLVRADLPLTAREPR
jgi:signal transduction histidine kinase